MDLIGPGHIISETPNRALSVQFANDYSYNASSYAGENYRIIGDAGAFIDPFFSNGIHLAVSGALSAAASICAVMRGDCSEVEAAQWHSSRVGTSYTRFLVVVLSAYQQMNSQNSPVLADLDEANFERAFMHFRPIIQGLADTESPLLSKVTNEELRATLEFCAQAYMPPEPEEESITPTTASKLQLVSLLGSSETLDALSSTSLDGFMLRLRGGKLGLQAV